MTEQIRPRPKSTTARTRLAQKLTALNSAQWRYLGYEGSLFGSESDDDPARAGFDDLALPEPGVTNTLTCPVLCLDRRRPLGAATTRRCHAPSAAACGAGECAGDRA